MRKKNISLAVRLLVLMTIFILFIFSAIFYVYNMLIQRFILNETTAVLNDVTIGITALNITFPYGGLYYSITEIPDIMQQNPALYQILFKTFYDKIITYLNSSSLRYEVESVLYDSDYNRIYPTNGDESDLSLGLTDSLLLALSKKTDGNDYGNIKVNNSEYYYRSIDLNRLYGLYNCNVLLFINVDKYNLFLKEIYSVLSIVLITAMSILLVFVALISRSLSKPLANLCHFAEEIGKGNFRRMNFRFRDRELDELNTRMNETASRLEEYDRDQKTFFQNVSHELRTPLMSIRGYAEGIKYGVFNDGEEISNAADIIVSETSRMTGLVEDLLYISRIDSNKAPETSGDTELGGLLRTCVERLNGLILNGEKRIKLFTSGDMYCRIDEDEISRAVINIAANGLRYAKKTVIINAFSDNGTINIIIDDDGNGIDPGDLPHIFDRFYKGAGGKQGIGLSIAKTIIEKHGGTIYAQNLPGSGARFRIALPQ